MTANSRVRLGRIGFVNVAPVYYGLKGAAARNGVELVQGTPTELNRWLAAGELDVSPVSSLAYGVHARDWALLPGRCIACRGPVKSVLLTCRVPIEDLDGREVLLTEDSATSVALVKLLLADRGVSPRYRTARVTGLEDLGDDTAAALVIGDRALATDWRGSLPHVFDLGQWWYEATGLPFVFAVWAVRRPFLIKRPDLVSLVADKLADSYEEGRKSLDLIAALSARALGLSPEFFRDYFGGLVYELGGRETEGLREYFKKLHGAGMLPGPVEPEFIDLNPAE